MNSCIRIKCQRFKVHWKDDDVFVYFGVLECVSFSPPSPWPDFFSSKCMCVFLGLFCFPNVILVSYKSERFSTASGFTFSSLENASFNFYFKGCVSLSMHNNKTLCFQVVQLLHFYYICIFPFSEIDTDIHELIKCCLKVLKSFKY